MTKPSHSPTLWRISHHDGGGGIHDIDIIYDAKNGFVCEDWATGGGCPSGKIENFHFIIHAVNNHSALVEALREMVEVSENARVCMLSLPPDIFDEIISTGTMYTNTLKELDKKIPKAKSTLEQVEKGGGE